MDFEKDFVGTEEEREMMIEDHNTCCLCGSDLKFQHQVDYLTLVVKEEAHCPSCKIQMRKRDHTLQ